MRNSSSYKCSECGSAHAGGRQCMTCGTYKNPESTQRDWSAEKMSPAAKVYTGVFVVWGLIFPFLLPIILKLSHIYQ